MDHADNNDDGIFVYKGGRAPLHITHARIDESMDEIEDKAFDHCENLLTVETHDGIRRVRKQAFMWCKSLRLINLKSVVEIDDLAFLECDNLESVDFGDRLEMIGCMAFSHCKSLKHLKLPSVITIEAEAFSDSERMTDIELSERLETIETQAFYNCKRLQRIAIPLKRDLIAYDYIFDEYNQFDGCEQLTTVDLVGGIHKTVASLHMESWRTNMNKSINRINQVLPNTSADNKTDAIREWMELVIDKRGNFKSEHYRYVKEGINLLELALWKAKLGEAKEYVEEGKTKKAKVDAESARKGKRITCGADTVIKNVLPFLKLE